MKFYIFKRPDRNTGRDVLCLSENLHVWILCSWKQPAACGGKAQKVSEIEGHIHPTSSVMGLHDTFVCHQFGVPSPLSMENVGLNSVNNSHVMGMGVGTQDNIVYWRTPEYKAISLFFTTIIGLIFGAAFWNLGHRRTNQQVRLDLSVLQ